MNGIVKAWLDELDPSFDTSIALLPSVFKVICCPVLKGWFGKYILWAGTDTVVVVSPTDTLIDDVIPTVVAIPTDCLGLKYTISSISELKKSELNGISKKLGIKLTFVDRVCAVPLIPLSTLKIFLSSNLFKTVNFSVPISILLPIEIIFVLYTKISAITPATEFDGISLYKIVLSVGIPDILCLPIKGVPVTDLISVVKPDIIRLFPISKSWVLGTNIDTVFTSFRTKVTFSSNS